MRNYICRHTHIFTLTHPFTQTCHSSVTHRRIIAHSTHINIIKNHLYTVTIHIKFIYPRSHIHLHMQIIIVWSGNIHIHLHTNMLIVTKKFKNSQSHKILTFLYTHTLTHYLTQIYSHINKITKETHYTLATHKHVDIFAHAHNLYI